MRREEYAKLVEQDQMRLKRRERNLKQTLGILTEELERTSPGSSANYYVRYKPVKKIFSGQPDPELEKIGRRLSAEEDPDYYSFSLVSRTNTRRGEEILQLPPNGADRKAAIIRETIAFGLLKYLLPQAMAALNDQKSR